MTKSVFLSLLIALPAMAAEPADTSCPDAFSIELQSPPEIRADSATHVLHTALDVGMRTGVPVPVIRSGGTCSMMPFDLRNYGMQSSAGFTYGFPGPTLRVRRESDSYSPGDSIRVMLRNSLPVVFDDVCNPSCRCTTDTATNPLCCAENPKVKYPNCFHGDNTTNLHFHGLHVSPREPQDFVFLELQPKGAGANSGHMAAHGRFGRVAQGSFEYKVAPLGKNTHEGTHWYHPHKHGSTALQVGNGMAGALIVEGPFDDSLNKHFTDNKQPLPAEKVMIVQQVHDLNYYARSTGARATRQSLPLINGVYAPKITMTVGEIQRWRIVSATMEASAQIELNFPVPGTTGALDVRQIAMDGIPLSPQNYAQQPMLAGGAKFQLSPGNRADFLVKALSPGLHTISYRVFGRVENQGRAAGGRPGQRVQQTRELLGDSQVHLLAVNVQACPEGTTCTPMTMPETLPAIDDLPSTTAPRHKLVFNLKEGSAGAAGNEPLFSITVDGKELTFDGSCAALTLPLNSVTDWEISQNQNAPTTPVTPFHVFHIHTNPFQVIDHPQFATKPKTPIWMDSITLPDASLGPVTIRQKVTDFTGASVLHCHFLGHEDRGMMLTVQTVCANKPKFYGTPDPKGGPDNCRAPTVAALKACVAPAKAK